MSSTNATLGAAVDDRKARLAKLKNLKRKQPADEVAAPESTRSPSPPAPAPAPATAEQDMAKLHLSGRNYDVEAKGPKLGFENAPTLNMEGPTLEEKAAQVEAEARQKALEEAAEADKGIDLFKLQPKKPNWDLKRDLDQKLDVLNVRTDNAIAKLVRERIAGAKKTEKETQKAVTGAGGDGDGDGDGDREAVGLDGVALVEAMRVREREDEEEEKREREDEALA
ncbi:hypothetical protein JX265_006906 [Neoarthrinium moseri]|uniref:Uncharacterized protein n=1 Tax=Neoarthrinium moseri TaxID=1658444 RepID=A0A9Q0AQF8_9PEZI|nr:hypothetical protein JX265_006906 [Neoarthrinium moseri]